MKYLFAVLRWILAAPLSILLVLITWLLAPALALAAFATEDPATKLGNLPRWLIWFQTHDAPLDEVWRGPGLYLKNFTSFAGKTQADFQASPGLRWWARTLWLWRNPAYGWRAHVLGYRHSPSAVVRVRKFGDWEVQGTSIEIYTALHPGNWLTCAAWGIRSKLFYTRTRHVRINIGWKLVMPGIAMVATHVNPIRRWDPAPPPVTATNNP